MFGASRWQVPRVPSNHLYGARLSFPSEKAPGSLCSIRTKAGAATRRFPEASRCG